MNYSFTHKFNFFSVNKNQSFTLIIIPILLLVILTIPFWGMTQDDTFIHLRYVKNILSGYGFSFNAGVQTYGTTSPLWTLLLAIILKFIPINPEVLSIFLSYFFGFASIIAMYFLADCFTLKRGWALLASLILVLHPAFIRWTGSGMETTLASFLVIIGLNIYINERNKSTVPYKSAIIFGLGFLVRPEMIIFLFIILLDQLIFNYNSQIWKRCILFSIIFLSICGVWWLYAYINFGTILPTTTRAKGVALGLLSTPLRTIGKLSLFIIGSSIVQLCILLIGSYVSIKKILLLNKNNLLHKVKEMSHNFVPWTWVIGLLLLYIIGNARITERYLLLIFPVINLYTLIFLKHFSENLKQRSEKWIIKPNKVVVLLFILLIIHSVLVIQFIHGPYVRGRIDLNNAYMNIGKWLEKNTPPGTTVAVYDIGIVGYYSDRVIIDLAGLVSPEIIPFLINKDKIEFIKAAKPDYIITDASPSEDSWIGKHTESIPLSITIKMENKHFSGSGAEIDLNESNLKIELRKLTY